MPSNEHPLALVTGASSGISANPSHFLAEIVMQPEQLVDASLAGLTLGEAICVPVLEDAGLLARIQEDQKKFFELSRTGKPAGRYQL